MERSMRRLISMHLELFYWRLFQEGDPLHLEVQRVKKAWSVG